MNKPKVSIILPVFNKEKFLKKAIESILTQTFKNFEFLILDDGSTDNSLKIIKGFKDKRIKVFSNKKRQGLAKGLNFLIKQAKGEYIARMDGDDISLSDRLKEQVRFLDKYFQIALTGSWVKIIDNKGKVVGEFKHPIEYKEIRKIILNYNPFVHPSVMFRKKIFKKLGGYDERLFYSQDYDLFLRFVANYSCANMPKFLLRFRWQPDFKKQKKQHQTALKVRFKAIKEYGYHKKEIIKLIKPFLFYLIPKKFKKLFWQIKFKVK